MVRQQVRFVLNSQGNTVAAQGVATKLCQADASRQRLQIKLWDYGYFVAFPIGAITPGGSLQSWAPVGFLLEVAGDGLDFTIEKDPDLVGLEWHGITNPLTLCPISYLMVETFPL